MHPEYIAAGWVDEMQESFDELLKVFISFGTAHYVIDIFSRLALHKPLTGRTHITFPYGVK